MRGNLLAINLIKVIVLSLLLPGCPRGNRGGDFITDKGDWIEDPAGESCQMRKRETPSTKFAYAYVAHDDDYTLGTLISAVSLREFTSNDILVMLTGEVTDKYLPLLESHGIRYYWIATNSLPPSKLDRYKYSMAEICAFKLTEYEKILFVDSDTLVYGSMDYLLDEHIGDDEVIGTSDSFDRLVNVNSNLLVTALFLLKPNRQIFNEIVEFNRQHPQNADMDLVNKFFDTKKKRIIDLPFHLNWQFNWEGIPRDWFDNLRVLHFNQPKPWKQYFDSISIPGNDARFYYDWKKIYKRVVGNH